MRYLAFAAAALLALPSPAHAWGKTGHRVVGAIAEPLLTPAARASVRRILGVETMAEASNWPDFMRADPAPYWQRQSTPWHYVTVPRGRRYAQVTPPPEGDAVTALTRFSAVAKDKRAPLAERQAALRFVIHIVGDLHQPLHAGDKGDKGGNDSKTTYGDYDPARLNLHSVWDGLLAERAISSPPPIVKRYPAAVRARLSQGTVTDWSRESWSVARHAYEVAMHGDPCRPTPERMTMSEADIESLVPIAREEVVKGGLRLARLLDQSLG